MADKRLILDIFTNTNNTKSELRDVADAADHTGHSVSGVSTEMGQFDKQIRQTKGELRGLLTEFNRGGDTTLLKDIKKTRSELTGLTALRKQFQALEKDAADAGAAAGAGLAQGLGRGAGTAAADAMSTSLKGPLIAAAIAIGAAMTIPIGAAIGGAVLGGVGLVGIAGGIAGASQNPRVQAAAKDFGTWFMGQFAAESAPMVEPLLRGLSDLRQQAGGILASLGQDFASLAPLVGPIIHGIGGLITNIMPGFGEAIKASQPALRVLAEEFPKIGSAIGDMLSTIASQSDGAILGLTKMVHLLETAIRFTGGVIAVLSLLFEWAVKADSAVSGFLEKLFGWVPILGSIMKATHDDSQGLLDELARGKDASNDFAGGIYQVGKSADDAAKKIDDMKTAMDKLFGIQMGLEEANIRWQKSIDDLSVSVEKNGLSLDIHTEKGRANRQAIDDEVTSIKDLRDANIAHGMSMEAADAAYQSQIASLLMTGEKLGFNVSELHQLLDAYSQMPKKAEVQVSAPGLGEALGKAIALSGVIAKLSGAYQAAQAGYGRDDIAPHRAAGGPVAAGGTYMVGERGPELVTFGSSGYVHNAASSAAMVGSSMSAPAVTVVLNVQPSGNALGDAVMREFARIVRIEYGGDVTQLGRSV